MRSLLPIFLLIAATAAAPVTVSERQKKILTIYGEDTDVPYAEGVLKEEAEKLGLTVDEYFNGCTDMSFLITEMDSFDITKEQRAELEAQQASIDKAALVKIVLNSTDEVLPALARIAPKHHALLMKYLPVFKAAVDKLDEKSKNFFYDLGDLTLRIAVKMSQTSEASKTSGVANPQEAMKFMMEEGKELLKMIKAYQDLPAASKANIEKNFCLNSTVRILDRDGEFIKALAMLQIAVTITEAMENGGMERSQI